jgi:hypothetical protein
MLVIQMPASNSSQARNNLMTTPATPPGEWGPCPSGKLKLLARGERVRQRRHFVIRATGAVGAVALVSGAVHQWIGSPEPVHDPVIAGISCSRVKELSTKFVSGTLEDDLTRRITAHVKQCPSCSALLESMRPKVSLQRPHDDAAQGGCECPGCRREALVAALTPYGNTAERPARRQQSSA